jgi:hypothetical protein
MRGLKLLASVLTREPDISIWSWASVTDDSPLRVQLDGETDPLDVTPDTLVAGLLVGDRVWVQLVTNPNPARRHRRLVVIGKAAGWDRMGCTLRRNTNQSIATAGSSAAISWSVEDFDSDAMWSSGTTTTIPAAGLWSFNFQVEWASAPGSGRTFLSIEDSTGAVFRFPYAGTGETFVSMSWTMPIAAGVTFTCKVLQSSGGAINVTTARLHCYRIGA